MKYKQPPLNAGAKTNSSGLILNEIERGSTVLEFGPAHGDLTRALKENLGCRVYIVELVAEWARNAARFSEACWVGDIEDYGWEKAFSLECFDAIIFADVLEHLRDPWQALARAKEFLKPRGAVWISIPNIAHNAVLAALLQGRFEYQEEGLLDRTHLRFFTYDSIKELLQSAGLTAVKELATYRSMDRSMIFNSMKEVSAEIQALLLPRPYGDVFQFVFKAMRTEDAQGITPERCIESHDPLKQQLHYNRIHPQLFVDCGHGYSKETSLTLNADVDAGEFIFEIAAPAEVKRFRFRPCQNKCVLRVREIWTHGLDGSTRRVEEFGTNAVTGSEPGIYIFDTTAPYIEFDGQPPASQIRLLVDYLQLGEISSIRLAAVLKPKLEALQKEQRQLEQAHNKLNQNLESERHKAHGALESERRKLIEQIQINRDMKETLAQSKADSQELNQQLAEHKRHISKLNSEIRDLKRRHAEVSSSLSWRLSAPLRRAAWALGLLVHPKRLIDLIRSARLIASSDLFDRSYYLKHNPDLNRTRGLLWHYLIHGGHEGRRPSAAFDGHFYLQSNQDVAQLGMNPLVHYLRYGRAEGRLPLPLRQDYSELREHLIRTAVFDPVYYLQRYPDADTSGLPTFDHYLQVGVREGRCATPMFEGLIDWPTLQRGVAGRQTEFVSIVIPVFNQKELTAKCLESIDRHTRADSFEVIVVDNGSSDGTREMLGEFSKRFAWLRQVTYPTNLMFAMGCNLGVAHSRGEYIVLLNNDTEVCAEWLPPLITPLREDPQVGMVGPKLIYGDDTLQAGGIVFNALSKMPYHIYRGIDRNHPAINKRRYYQAITGACLACRAAEFISLRGFAPIYLNGCEDLELCLRYQQELHKLLLYNPLSEIYHHESRSLGRGKYISFNRSLFVRRWRGFIRADDQGYFDEDGFETVEYNLAENDPEGETAVYTPTLRSKTAAFSPIDTPPPEQTSGHLKRRWF